MPKLLSPKDAKLLILHGWGGSDFPHWQSQLASHYAQNYGTVAFPLLDNCHFPSKNRWIKQLKALLREFKPDIVVCHSLANTLWLWLCQDEAFMQEIAIKRLLLVSPPSLNTEVETIKTFFPAPLPKSLYAQDVEIIVSDNDPYITLEEAQEIALHYHLKLHIIKNGGHINAQSGFGKWEWIEDLLLSHI